MLGVNLKSKRLLAEWMFPTFLFGYLWPHAPSSISAAAKGSRQRIPVGGGEGAVDHRGIFRWIPGGFPGGIPRRIQQGHKPKRIPKGATRGSPPEPPWAAHHHIPPNATPKGFPRSTWETPQTTCVFLIFLARN
jgi:hypothetical protein